MAFFHGIQVSEKQTQIVAPVQVDSAVQVVVDLAPVNMGNLSDRWHRRLRTATRKRSRRWA